MGRRIWVVVPRVVERGIFEHSYDCRVLSLKQFLPADKAVGRDKHLVQLWTDPGGMRTLSVGSIRLRDPNRADAMRKRHERGDFEPRTPDMPFVED